MNERKAVIGDDELHAYVDGTLSDARRTAVEQALERDPNLAARISDYFALNNLLHERYDRALSEPVPQRLQPPNPKRRWGAATNWPQFAGLAAALLVGIGIGFGMQTGRSPVEPLAMTVQSTGRNLMRAVRADGSQGFAREAAIAHVVYMPMVQRPSGMGADEHDFAQWMASQLGTDAPAPILTSSGFELSGGRLLPGDNGPVAQFMYRDAKGERITVCISHRKVSANTTAFQLYEDGPVKVFYWVDGKFGYAVSGGIARETLLTVSHAVYAQLTAKD
jgi:anti-sigma factor RsiW